MPESQEGRVSRKTKCGLRESRVGMRKSGTVFKKSSFGAGLGPMLERKSLRKEGGKGEGN